MRGERRSPTVGDMRWGVRRGDASDEEQAQRGDSELPDDEQYYGVGLSADALDAHRQVLEMANTIDILTRDFENQQQELLHAYKKLEEYVGNEPKSPTERGAARKLFRRHCDDNDNDDDDGEDAFEHSGGCCSHQDELHELRELVGVKDTALNEALQQRNKYRVQLERAEALIKEFRWVHLQDGSGGGNRIGWKVHPTGSSMGGYYASGMAMSCTQASLAPGYATLVPGGAGLSSGSASMMLGCNGAIEVPRNERFDHESTYQRKENDELFWRKQYKEAVRMRKKYGLVNPTASAGNNNSSNHARAGHHYQQQLQQQQGNGLGNGAPRPSLKIFSYPDHRRQKGIKDENVPFSRYIGISARQHEIIKEQHRMLA